MTAAVNCRLISAESLTCSKSQEFHRRGPLLASAVGVEWQRVCHTTPSLVLKLQLVLVSIDNVGSLPVYGVVTCLPRLLTGTPTPQHQLQTEIVESPHVCVCVLVMGV
jgi:hypothetical protein